MKGSPIDEQSDDVDRAADAEPIDPALPVAFSVTRKKRSLDRHEHDATLLLGRTLAGKTLEKSTGERLKNQQVLVHANGFEARGKLIGADENELYLKTETRWLVLPLDRVTSVRALPKPKPVLSGAVDVWRDVDVRSLDVRKSDIQERDVQHLDDPKQEERARDLGPKNDGD